MPEPEFNCTKQQVHQAVADWAGVSVSAITSQTLLDGLGGKSWPRDASPLISTLSDICECSIPSSAYELFARVEDIDEFVGAGDNGE
jgi:hypothetical protein